MSTWRLSRKNCTGRILYWAVNFRNQNCTARYNFGCEMSNGLAKSVPGMDKGPLAITDVGLSVLLCLVCGLLE